MVDHFSIQVTWRWSSTQMEWHYTNHQGLKYGQYTLPLMRYLPLKGKVKIKQFIIHFNIQETFWSFTNIVFKSSWRSFSWRSHKRWRKFHNNQSLHFYLKKSQNLWHLKHISADIWEKSCVSKFFLLVSFFRFQCRNVALWGLWQGKGKPPVYPFLKPFTQELLNLSQEGKIKNCVFKLINKTIEIQLAIVI